VTRAFLKSAAARSVLVNVSTAISHIPATPGGSAVGASKAAGVRFMEFITTENPTVRVVNLHPGSMETDMNNKAGIKLPMDDGKLLPLAPQVSVVIRRTSSNHDSLAPCS
jgi:NAD(P)-dependent dehydrogenase (short-subunit alcohol dehydrogenase family)